MKVKLAILGVASVLCVSACSGDTEHATATGGAPGTAGSGNISKAGNSSGGSSSHGGAATVGTNTALEDFPYLYAERVCQLLVRCYAQPIKTLDPDCATFFERLIREQTFPQMTAAIAEGRTEYHPELVPQCLDEVSTATCDIGLVEFCPRVFVGTKKTGEACTTDLECVDQQCTVNGACPGACAAPGALGAVCTSENRCAQGLACSAGPDDTRKCVTTAKLGETCSKAVPCLGYTICKGLDYSIADDTGTCVNASSVYTGKLDEPCEVLQGLFCEPDLVCTTRVQDGITVGSCRPKVASGSACTYSSPDACPDTEYCRISSAAGVKPATGTCTVRPGLGEECYGTFGVAPCGREQACNLETEVCAKVMHLGEPCGGNSECYSNRCSADGKCVALLECEKSAEP